MSQDRPPPSEISLLLTRWGAGDREAMDRLFSLVYGVLRQRARRQLRRGGRSATLSTTALVHETFLKLVDGKQAAWADRNHFFAVASTAMRHILVDHARKRLTERRGKGMTPELLDENTIAVDDRAEELLALDSALERLKKLDERSARVVELKFYGGLSFEDSAAVLDLSPRTVKREWRKARAFLYDALTSGANA